MISKYLSKAVLVGGFLLANSAMAATSVAWLTPPDNSHFVAGTSVNVTGQAAGQGQVGGTGLDLVLVMDSSGSMSWSGGQAAQHAAANAIVDALPQATTSVAIVDFDSSAYTKRGLTQLDGTNTALHNSINSVDASGGTAIHAGINQAASILTGTDATASRLQAMIVMSDGSSTVSLADSAADAAMASGVEAIHSVGMGASYSATALQASVNGVDDVYGNSDDYGTFVGSSFNDLIALFSGTSGNLVGLDHIDITLPDSTVLYDHATDALGNFNVNYALALGANVFSVTAYGTDGSTASASWTLYGDASGQVPEPGTLLLFGLGVLGLTISRKKVAANR
jgi:Ca-activated chloride channel homolog